MKTNLAFALILLLPASLMFGWLVGEATKPPPMVPVLVAAANLPVETFIDRPAIQLAFRGFPKDRVPPDAITDANQLQHPTTIVRSLRTGDPCTFGDIWQWKLTVTQTPPGMRSLWLPINFDSGIVDISSLPGSRVDLVLIQCEDGSRHVSSDVFLEDVLLLGYWSVQGGMPPVGIPQVISIALSPEDIPKVLSVKEKGRVSISLRRPDDS